VLGGLLTVLLFVGFMYLLFVIWPDFAREYQEERASKESERIAHYRRPVIY
jgi:hypothetical protein